MQGLTMSGNCDLDRTAVWALETHFVRALANDGGSPAKFGDLLFESILIQHADIAGSRIFQIPACLKLDWKRDGCSVDRQGDVLNRAEILSKCFQTAKPRLYTLAGWTPVKKT